jgi:hypothetical protein
VRAREITNGFNMENLLRNNKSSSQHGRNKCAGSGRIVANSGEPNARIFHRKISGGDQSRTLAINI